jgi:hypothetical protein
MHQKVIYWNERQLHLKTVISSLEQPGSLVRVVEAGCKKLSIIQWIYSPLLKTGELTQAREDVVDDNF